MTQLLTTLFLLLASLAPATGEPETKAVHVGVGQQTTITPGFAIGDVNGVNSKVADYVIARSRRHLTLAGHQPGTASVSLWDQQGRHRLDITVSVARELDAATAASLQAFLEGFPDVQLAMLQGVPTLSGTVDDQAALQLVRDVATASGVVSLVAVRPRVETKVPVPTPPPAKRPITVEYELRLLEADLSFGTQAYDEGVEPSGRELYRTTITAVQDATAQTLVGGRAAMGAQKRQGAQPSPSPEVGLRISLTPRGHTEGRTDTEVSIETNLPIVSTVYVPSEWRRFSQHFVTGPARPLAVAGNELLAAPPPPQKGSKVKRAAVWIGRVAGLPGVPDVKGVSQIPVFAGLVSSVGYREGRTQLVLVIRPRLVAQGTE